MNTYELIEDVDIGSNETVQASDLDAAVRRMLDDLGEALELAELGGSLLHGDADDLRDWDLAGTMIRVQNVSDPDDGREVHVAIINPDDLHVEEVNEGERR